MGLEMERMAMFGGGDGWDCWDGWDDWGCWLGGMPDFIQAVMRGMKDWAKEGSIDQIPFNIL